MIKIIFLECQKKGLHTKFVGRPLENNYVMKQAFHYIIIYAKSLKLNTSIEDVASGAGVSGATSSLTGAGALTSSVL